MKVTVRLGGSLAGPGTREWTFHPVPGDTIGTLLESLGSDRSRGDRDVRLSPADTLTILLNGRNIEFLKGLATSLADGDVVAIFPASEGG